MNNFNNRKFNQPRLNQTNYYEKKRYNGFSENVGENGGRASTQYGQKPPYKTYVNNRAYNPNYRKYNQVNSNSYANNNYNTNPNGYNYKGQYNNLSNQNNYGHRSQFNNVSNQFKKEEISYSNYSNRPYNSGYGSDSAGQYTNRFNKYQSNGYDRNTKNGYGSIRNNGYQNQNPSTYSCVPQYPRNEATYNGAQYQFSTFTKPYYNSNGSVRSDYNNKNIYQNSSDNTRSNKREEENEQVFVPNTIDQPSNSYNYEGENYGKSAISYEEYQPGIEAMSAGPSNESYGYIRSTINYGEENNDQNESIGKKKEIQIFYGRHESFPDELNLLINLKECGICGVVFNSPTSSKLHYDAKAHDKNITNWLYLNYVLKGRQIPPMKRTHETLVVSNRDLHCDICDLRFTSVIHGQQHYAGRRHRINLRRKEKFSHIPQNLKEPLDDRCHNGDPSKVPRGGLSCSLCNVYTTSSAQMSTHISGTNHQRKLKLSLALGDDEKAESDKASREFNNVDMKVDYMAYRSSDGQFFCDICKVHLNHENILKQHLFGRKHLKKELSLSKND